VRYLVLSDIHANLDALDAVIAAAAADGYDAVAVLGDLVGYGAEPNRVVDRVRSLSPVAMIRGNHDKVAAGLESADSFNPTAQESAAWTQAAITEATRTFLLSLPRGPVALDGVAEICHGSPVDEDVYIFSEAIAAEALLAMTRRVCLFGHTHLPAATALGPGEVIDVLFHGAGDGCRLALGDGRRYLINPGSVGQPRDGDPRAAYAILDTLVEDVVIRRVAYPVEQACERILAAGLPKALGERLIRGR
jgi:predicted phosphodiesterase